MKVIKHKKKQININIKNVIRRGVWLIAGFALSFSSVLGGCCPFAVSLISASNKKNFLFSTVGAGIGYIIFCEPTDAIRYFSSVIICCMGTFANNIFNEKKSPSIPMLISFLSVLSTGVVMNIRLENKIPAYAISLGEAILALGCSFFFYCAVNCNIGKLKLRALPIGDLTCVIISLSILFSSLSFIEIYGLSLARILSILIILCSIRFSSGYNALIISLCLGFSLGISKENSLFLIGAYAFSTLLAMLFSNISSFAIGIGFTFSMTFFAVAVSLGKFSLCCVIESIIASIILALLPQSIAEKLSQLENSNDIIDEGNLRQSLVVRLRFASAAIAQVSESVRSVREKMDKLNDNQPLESEIRMVAADQFFSISDMLEDLAFEFNEAEIFDFKGAAKIRRKLGEYDIYAHNVCVIIDKFNRQRIEILVNKNTVGMQSVRLRNEICKICHREFENAKISKFNDKSIVTFIEKPNYKMEIGFAQHCAVGNLCGDTIKTINDGRGHLIFIISDGMGKGGQAALDGAMGAGLLSKLLTAGFSFDASLKVVNSALLVKSSEESLATLDCASVDLFSGKCEFFKAGAPKSYIKKQSRLVKCQLSSMPAGILRGIEFAKRTTILNTDDEIILMSDGITDIDEDELEAYINSLDCDNLTQKANEILQFALSKTDQNHIDDMSIIIGKLKIRN